MKRIDLIRLLTKNGCELLREGSRHSIWKNLASGDITVVPRHKEIKKTLARKICKDLFIKNPYVK